MRKSNYKYKVYNGKIIKELLKNSRIYLFVFLFITGIILGAFFIKQCNGSTENEIREICNAFIKSKAGQGVLTNFFSSFSVSVGLSAVNIFLGFSLIGYPLIIWLPFLKGLGLGTFSGYMYATYKFTGLGYCAILVYPGAVISAFALILACCDSCDYSRNAFEKSIRGKGQFEKDETKIYLIRQLMYIGVSAFSILIEALFLTAFSELFKF